MLQYRLFVIGGAEPAAVQGYYNTAILATDSLLTQVVGKPLNQIILTDAITRKPMAAHIEASTAAIEQRRYFDAMIAARKALFLAVEASFDIYKAREADSPARFNPTMFFCRAASYKQNGKWIRENVQEPTDYIQLDHEQVKSEMWEIGIDPRDFFNVWRITPAVYLHEIHGWVVSREFGHEAAATEDNARYCLDIVSSIIINQERHGALIRDRSHFPGQQVRLLNEETLRLKAEAQSESTGPLLPTGKICSAISVVHGLDDSGEYVKAFIEQDQRIWLGFIPLRSCVIEETAKEVDR